MCSIWGHCVSLISLEVLGYVSIETLLVIHVVSLLIERQHILKIKYKINSLKLAQYWILSLHLFLTSWGLLHLILLMANQQAIKMNNNHEWIDMVTKIEKLQIFWKPHKLIILDRFSKVIILEHSEVFNFQIVSFSIFDLYIILKDILMDICQLSWIKV
jgi:hypothetical protein